MRVVLASEFAVSCFAMQGARGDWEEGKPTDAGSLLYESISVEDRPAWAAEILRFCCSLVDEVPDEVDAVIRIARERAEWSRAHQAFRAVRRLNLAHYGASDPMKQALLLVAENAAKVVFNASGSPAPFDYDCGAWLVCCLRQMTDLTRSDIQVESAWAVASSMSKPQRA